MQSDEVETVEQLKRRYELLIEEQEGLNKRAMDACVELSEQVRKAKVNEEQAKFYRKIMLKNAWLSGFTMILAMGLITWQLVDVLRVIFK